MRPLRAVVIAGLVAGSAVWAAPAAYAACHAFTVTATSPVTEGGAVNVTVSRDAAVADSNITVSTVDGSANAGSDYTMTQKTISFTGSSTSQSFSVPTTNDATVESDETFKLHMSSPGGCAVNPNFSVGPDATVIIKDNDIAAATTAKPATTLRATTTTARGATTSTAVGAATSAASTSTTESDTTTSTIADDDDDSGSSAALLIGGLVVVAAAATAVAIALRRRRQQV